MDQVFSAVTLPAVGQTTTIMEHHQESHTVFHQESHHVESHHEHMEFSSSGVIVGNVVGHDAVIQRRPTVDTEDQRSEVSAMSKATSVSVHSSVSQKSAQHYDLPPIPQYDMPPIVVGEAVVGKAPSVASSRSGSHHSVASHHSHHSQHSHHSALTHDSESTISEGTLVNEPIVVGAHVASEAPTPLAVGQSFEHDAVIEQFKNLHGRDQSVVSSIVPASVHIQSDSEDSIAPSKLTHSIAVGGVVDSHNGVNVLHRSHEVEFVDFAAPAYYQPPSVVGAFDAHSEDSFGFEKVEYVDTHEDHHHKLEEQVPQVVHEHVIEQHYEPYQIVHENHNVLSVDFGEDQHSITHHDHDHHHHHHESHVTHTFTSNVKQSRSNTASTYQSRQMLAHNVGPKITEELRPAAVLEEEEVEVRPPVMAYVAPIPVKPPRTHEESHIYNAYETEIHQQKDIVKSTTVVLEDVRSGSEGVSSLRRKFEHGAPPPLSPVFEMKKHEHHKHLDQHHHHKHQDVVVEQTQFQKVSEHVQLGGSRKSTIQSGHHHHHHHDHENRNDVPSRPSSVANYVKHQPHSRTSTVSTVRGAPVQRVNPTVQQHVIYNPYGDHQSVRVVKNVREFVNVFGATHVVPPPTPLAGVPRLSQRSPISHETFQPHDECNSVKSSRKNTLVSVGKGIQINDAPRKSTCSSVASSRSSSVSTVSAPILVGGNIAVPTPRSRNATLTQENVHEHDQYDDLIHVADMRKLFENYGPAHLPEYASNPSAYIH